MTARWRVGAILNETLADTLRFAAWYLEAGADGLTLLFDNAQDPAIEVLGDHPKIDCIACTPEFWETLGLKQDTRFTKRQNVALTWIYRQQSDGWLLNVDADEFMYLADGDIASFLAGVPEDILSVRVETAEIVIAPESLNGNLYRMPMERDVARRVYLDNTVYFGPRRKGLIGHPQGKSFVRCGHKGIGLRQHWPQSKTGERLEERFVEARTGPALLHHIGLDYDTWRKKLSWRTNASGFTVPLSERINAAIAADDAEQRLQKLHAVLHGVDAEILARLRAEGACREINPELDKIAARHFGASFLSV